MREKISVFYYPDFWVDYATLVKAILLFDELHFMDRPSMMFQVGVGQVGTIGAISPLRQYEASFREEGVPFYVHAAQMGPVQSERYEEIKSDINDHEFLRRFQNGLESSIAFRDLQIARGDYGQFGNHESVAARLIAVDLSAELKNYESPFALFEEPTVRAMDLSSAVGCAKHLIFEAVVCSAKLNFALNVGTKHGFYPLADAQPYGDLLGAKYARAIRTLGAGENKIQLTDLSFAVLDDLIPSDRIRSLKLSDVLRYRKASEKAREEFLEHLNYIQRKQALISLDGDYAGAIEKLIVTEIKPAVRTFRNRLEQIDESLFGAIVKGVVGAIAGSSAVTVFGDLSWPKIMSLTSVGAAYVAKATIDAILAERSAKRECSISYLLSLDK